MIDTDTSLLFATRNHNKTLEFESLLGDFINPLWRVFDVGSWSSPVPEVVEDRETFWENAVKKAMEVSKNTGSVTISDDSGLEVDALDGRPGVYSARYSGPGATDRQNNEKLVAELDGVPAKKRGARYVSVVALAMPENMVGRALMSRTGVPFEEVGVAAPIEEGKMVRLDGRVLVWFRGEVEGRIVAEPRGSNGFGYDPHFYVPEFDRTMAEVSLAQKNTVSHRARALRKMVEFFPGTNP
jgi:XTP/dITP diphosphohydrolase